MQAKVVLLHKTPHLNSEQFHVLEYISDVSQYQTQHTAHWSEVQKN